MREHIVNLIYLVAAMGFALSLKWMSQPPTARRGILAGEIGFGLAVAATLINPDFTNEGFVLIAIALVIGTAIGVPLGLRVADDRDAPADRALARLRRAWPPPWWARPTTTSSTTHMSKFTMAVLGVEMLLGFLVFTGSLMAAGKLQEMLPQRPIVWAGQNLFNFAVLGLALALIAVLVFAPGETYLVPILIGLALTFGVLLIIPIGGADMPTVIALLNSYAGLSAAGTGLRARQQAADHRRRARRHLGPDPLDHHVQGDEPLLPQRAVRRLRRRPSRRPPTARAAGPVRTATPDEAAAILQAARLVVIVPGYGMAVAQAQHKVRELADALEAQGVEVRYAIHPVAGRMPGHMNVLLAEANVPYDQLLRHGRDQPRVPAGRRRAGDRRQRRGEPGRPARQEQPDLRHADPRRRQGPDA